jgi:hypothetical protein
LPYLYSYINIQSKKLYQVYGSPIFERINGVPVEKIVCESSTPVDFVTFVYLFPEISSRLFTCSWGFRHVSLVFPGDFVTFVYLFPEISSRLFTCSRRFRHVCLLVSWDFVMFVYLFLEILSRLFTCSRRFRHVCLHVPGDFVMFL